MRRALLLLVLAASACGDPAPAAAPRPAPVAQVPFEDAFDDAKLDVVADELFCDAMAHSGLVCTLVSEEREEPEYVVDNWENANYTVFYDPLDGSSNLDLNVTVGSIFSISTRMLVRVLSPLPRRSWPRRLCGGLFKDSAMSSATFTLPHASAGPQPL